MQKPQQPFHRVASHCCLQRIYLITKGFETPLKLWRICWNMLSKCWTKMILRVQPDSFNNNLLILSVIPASAAMFMLCIWHIQTQNTWGIKHITCMWLTATLPSSVFTTAVSLLADIWLKFLNTVKSRLWYHPQFNSVHIWNAELYSHIIARSLQNMFWHCSAGIWRVGRFSSFKAAVTRYPGQRGH